MEQSGFKKYVRGGIVVQIAQTSRLDIPLQVGDMTEEVQVVGEAPLVRSNTAELGQVIEMKQIQALPLNGRFFQHLITMTPGAMPFYGRGDSAENASAAGAKIATAHTVNGMPWSGNNYLLDGVVNNEMQNAYINITPPLEAIQEFKVQTNNPTAEFGVFGGAAVNLTLRSGTNELHGSVFEYLRDDALNTKSYFAPTKAPYNSHQFGATLGGPILKNRAFFFADYQGLRLDQGRTAVLTVPTALMRQGNFSEIRDVVHDPLTGQPFPGNVIPAGRQNPITRQVLNEIYPLPNAAGPRQQLRGEHRAHPDRERGRRAHRLPGERQRLALRPLLDGETGLRRPVSREHLHGQRRPPRRPTTPSPATTTASSATPTPSGRTKFFEVRVGYNRYWTHQFAEDFGVDKNNQLGIPNGNLSAYPESSGLASFQPAGFTNTGSPGTTNAIRVGTTYHLTGNFSWLHGKHNFKAGADARFVSGAVSNPADAAAGAVHVRPQLHEPGRGLRHRLLDRDHAPRLSQPDPARRGRHLAAHPPQLRRPLRPGRPAGQPQALRPARPAVGPHDAARAGRRQAVELLARPTASSTSPPPTTAAPIARRSGATSLPAWASPTRPTTAGPRSGPRSA